MPTTPDGRDELDAALVRAGKRDWNVDAMWARVRADTVDGRSAATPPIPRRAPAVRVSTPRLRWWQGGLAFAAGIIAALVMAGDRSRHVRPAYVAPREYTTGRAEGARVTLSDGSKVDLGPLSRLVVPADFNDGLRELTLEGEAVFDVHHDDVVPFVVVAGKARLVDVGTRFDVRAYEGDASVTVAVADGAVWASHAGHPGAIEVHRGQVARLDARRVAVVGTDVEAELAWTRGSLSVRDRRLGDVITMLSRWHKLVVTADRSLLNRRVTAELSTEDADTMLETLAAALHVRVKRTGPKVTLHRIEP